ncbi:helix-hairpin-helix domain-containing protein [Blastococcus sp. TML/M2B]|uniref:ComEA family DNA-binding protein n=1 Tax=unclassified Blastococcus TaxID=2619396 RepID=UPI00190B97B9|nr:MULTISPECIES: helix-hairpin-helix domain-containing protein [unclassified Blastococcus]MBN1093318.1 helix-hairpin-helix domain-containing protein [Blastococcus sp. TML/M2B]MBN1096567.1 helix-hairpin-helix domain-containing protein [Blastococcus sp. TML/C7B]
MTPPPYLPAPPPRGPSTSGERFRAGGWYLVLAIASAGIFAAVPFWHAATRLGRRDVRTLALTYTAAGIYLVVLFSLMPPQQPDGTSGNPTLSTIGGLSALFVIVMACIQLRPLRRAVYGGGGVVPVHADPLVARALAARARREETRRLIEANPGLQRELGIGRPDLGRGYDDGGLIDVNTAPAEVIARVTGIDAVAAEAIVQRRAIGPWYDMAELVVRVPLTASALESLQERAVF